MKKIITVLLLTLIGWSNALNAQWLTNNTSWVSTSLNVTNPTYIFDNNEATAGSITCPNHTETWGSVEINLNQSVAIDSVRYKWTRRDRKYDYSQGVASWFKTRLSYYNSTSSQWVVFMTDSLDTSTDNGSVSTRTGWSYKKTSLNVTASKFKLEIGTWWWWVNSVDFTISELYLHNKPLITNNCNFTSNSTTWLGTADISNASNIIDNNQSTFGYIAMSNYSTTYTKSALINFPAAKSISSFKFKYSFPTITGNNSCTWPSGSIAYTSKVKLYYDNGSGWQEAYPVTNNLNATAPIGVCEYTDSVQYDFANTITSSKWKIEMTGNYWLGGGYQTTTYFKLFEVGFKECSINDGLVAWYPFNGNANDASGNGNNGTVNGSTLTTDRFGNANSAYSFNGTNNSMDVQNSSSLSLPNDLLSISFWLNVLSYPVSGETMLISKYSGIGTTTSGFMTEFSNNYFLYRYQSTTGGWGFLQIPYSSLPTAGSWFNVVITTNAGYDKLYINGVLAASNTTKHNSHIGSNTSNLKFGIGPSQNPQSYYNGKIDDIRIYNKELLQVDVNALYNEGICFQSVTVTDTLKINVSLAGFNPISYKNNIKIYPNPTHDALTIDCGTNYNTLSTYKVKITNNLGQSIYESLVTKQISTVNLNSWTGKGIYVIQLIDGSSNVIDNKKIVLQ
jgi:hypothetical protein